MLFNSYTFLMFFVVVLAGYYLTRSWKVRKGILLVASYVFYAAWNPPFVVLLWLSTVVDWLAAKGIHASVSPRRRRLLMAVSLMANFGLLGYFKYAGFMVDNFLLLARALGLHVSLASPNVILPVGISFYTFQTLSYVLDVYRRKIVPERSFLDYALYVTFFPQLVAGPIIRAEDFLPQCTQPKACSGNDLGWGLSLMLLGLFEKVAIADGILAPIVESVYDTVGRPDFISAWCGTFAFAGQIFLDFAGYSLVAIGSALCLGFTIQDNFRFPYAAVGFSDFWARWHMSLSSWLRDYLYIPLGGSRKGPFRTFASLMITMLLGGLWHGASWTFVIWGGLHGLYLVLQRGVTRIIPWRPRPGSIAQLPLALLTFLLVSVAWVFFRAHSLGQAFGIAATLFGAGPRGAKRLLGPESIVPSLGVTVTLLSVHWLMRDASIASIVSRIPWWGRSLALAALAIGILGLSGEDRAFIYFQF
jgi:D-alanyl-lipoteichoic acid acyltransferase DltB (MBOAT superfamily)